MKWWKDFVIERPAKSQDPDLIEHLSDQKEPDPLGSHWTLTGWGTRAYATWWLWDGASELGLVLARPKDSVNQFGFWKPGMPGRQLEVFVTFLKLFLSSSCSGAGHTVLLGERNCLEGLYFVCNVVGLVAHLKDTRFLPLSITVTPQ